MTRAQILGICLTGAILLLVVRAHAADLPDPTLTPGATIPTATAATLCAKTYTTKSVRNVSQAEKDAVYAEYHMQDHKGDCGLVKLGCEVDHLISLEVGGSNDLKNLWPQSYGTMPWNAHVKDILENRLHALVCAGTITLDQAQTKIRTNWIAAYKQYVKPGAP